MYHARNLVHSLPLSLQDIFGVGNQGRILKTGLMNSWKHVFHIIDLQLTFTYKLSSRKLLVPSHSCDLKTWSLDGGLSEADRGTFWSIHVAAYVLESAFE